MSRVVVVPFAEAHLEGALALCRAQGWPTMPADPPRALRVLTGPSAVSFVALDDTVVVGFAFAFSGGEIDVYLSLLVVAPTHRRQGIAGRLIAEVFGVSGVDHMDLLAEPGSEPFYESLPHRSLAGYRLYPPGQPGAAGAPG